MEAVSFLENGSEKILEQSNESKPILAPFSRNLSSTREFYVLGELVIIMAEFLPFSRVRLGYKSSKEAGTESSPLIGENKLKRRI